jgi:hypothetical protein
MLNRTDVIIVEMGANIPNPDVHVNKPSVQEILTVCHRLADDLLEMHKATGISLDNWWAARTFVQAFTGDAVEPNGA